MHIHFDKDIYLPGETIWFKAYLYSNGLPSNLSTNFYAAIYDENGKQLQQKLYPVTESTCNGDFIIPDTVNISRIQFRAFTKAMLMADSNNIFEKVLTVYHKDGQLVQTPALEKSISLQFFPEGGNWVADVSNFIAFKAWYADGRPAQVSGTIVDEQSNTVIDSFTTNNMGMGKLQITPQEKIYTAVWRSPNGTEMRTALPVVSPYGISFHAELVKDQLYYIINKNIAAENFRTLHLLAQMGNEELYKADILLEDKNRLVNKFAIDSLPSGIVQLTLFDNNWNPLQQRIVFINAAGSRNPYVQDNGRNNAAKAKNSIELVMPDTTLTNLSASIADIDFYDRPGSHTIQQDLWFNAQLKGLNNDISGLIKNGDAAAIDLIMLTHGWRRYNWQKAVNSQAAPQPVDNYLGVTINYKQKDYALPKNETISLIINDISTGKQFYTLEPSAQNSFSKTGMIFYDSTRMYYQLAKNKELTGNLSVSRDNIMDMPNSIGPLKLTAWKNATATPVIQRWVDSLSQHEGRKFNDVLTYKEVVVKSRYVNPVTKRTLQLDDRYATGMFKGIARGFQFNVIDDPNADLYFDIFSYLQAKAPGLFVRRSISGVSLYNSRGNVLVFLDEREMEGDDMGFLSATQVAYIKYIPGIVVGSSFTATGGGAVYIYTRKGNDLPSTPGSMRSVNLKGYDMPKEFFNPDYSDKASQLQPDLRSTVYWNPYIITDKNNTRVKIEYYNNDLSKKLLLTIEGFNEAGKLIHIEKVIE